jgi:hypothetical protein
MKKILLGLSLLGFVAYSGTSVNIKGKKAAKIISGLLSANVEATQLSDTTTYSYSVQGLICKYSNHGGPGDMGYSYQVGCYANADLQQSYGETGTQVHDYQFLTQAVGTALTSQGVDFGDCATGKCYESFQSIICSVDTNMSIGEGAASCLVELPNN